MINVVSYVTNNYIWFLCVIVIILLSIIGRYAEKTNFGEGKKIVKVKKKKNEEEQQSLKNKNQPLVVDEKSSIEPEIIDEKNIEKKDAAITEDLSLVDDIEKSKLDEEKPLELMTEDDFLKSDNLDVLLPKKVTFNDDLLRDIENLNFDFTSRKRKKSTEIQGFDDLLDLDLPSIKTNSSSNDDIWK